MDQIKQTTEAMKVDKSNYSKEALDGLERIIRDTAGSNWSPNGTESDAVREGLATEMHDWAGTGDRYTPTSIGILVFDEIAIERDAKFRLTPTYQKRLVSALRESMGMSKAVESDEFGTFDGQCGCPMCGSVQPVSILRGKTLPWWIYQINNLADADRLDPDTERASDLEFHLERN